MLRTDPPVSFKECAEHAGVTRDRLSDYCAMQLLPRPVPVAHGKGSQGVLPFWCREWARTLAVHEQRVGKLSKLRQAVQKEGTELLATLGCSYRALVAQTMDDLEELRIEEFGAQLDYACDLYDQAFGEWLARYGAVCGLV